VESEPDSTVLENDRPVSIQSTFDASILDSAQRERFLPNWRAASAVLAQATICEAAQAEGIGRQGNRI
jgi:hypothetical protein